MRPQWFGVVGEKPCEESVDLGFGESRFILIDDPAKDQVVPFVTLGIKQVIQGVRILCHYGGFGEK